MCFSVQPLWCATNSTTHCFTWTIDQSESDMCKFGGVVWICSLCQLKYCDRPLVPVVLLLVYWGKWEHSFKANLVKSVLYVQQVTCVHAVYFLPFFGFKLWGQEVKQWVCVRVRVGRSISIPSLAAFHQLQSKVWVSLGQCSWSGTPTSNVQLLPMLPQAGFKPTHMWMWNTLLRWKSIKSLCNFRSHIIYASKLPFRG